MDCRQVKFDTLGLVPGIVQTPSGQVRMLGYLNAEAIRRTMETGLVTFFSRSRGRLWTKGETSGNALRLLEMHTDCDGDALLIIAEPAGPTCHEGCASCFGHGSDRTLQWLADLEVLLKGRQASGGASGSYSQQLFSQGLDRIARKVAEETGEVIVAAKNHQTDPTCRDALVSEAADLLFHFQMLLIDRGVDLSEVVALLASRHVRTSGKV